MSLRVAITGGIACGKSLFSQCLKRSGIDLLDADDIVHQLEGPGGRAVPVLERLFGSEIVGADGGIDRRVLGERVFADHVVREQVNNVIHPLVREEIARWLEEPGAAVKAVVIPLLFEVGWDKNSWDLIICVASDEEVQLERLMKCRGLSEDQARRRMAAQMPVAEKSRRSHLTVHNNADAEALAREAARISRFLMEKSNEYRASVT